MENLLPLPSEIMTEIISRLPVESVLNCRLVCKTWLQSLTYNNNPSFALMHLRRSSLMTHHQHHLLVHDDEDDDQNHSNCSCSSSKVGFVSLIKLDVCGGRGPFQLYYGEYDDDERRVKKINHPLIDDSSALVGSCNGLLCFTVYHHLIHDPIYICNPITREYIKLPRFTKKGLKGGDVASGFGYHPKTNEYKVVRIYYQHDREPENDIGQVQVYTLGSGTSGWRNKGEIDFGWARGVAIIANGALHWRVRFGKILSFDLADEEFFLLPSPPWFKRNSQLNVLGGLLCATTLEEGGCVKVWSLKNTKSNSSSSYNMLKNQESCQSWSWSLEFSIKLWEGIPPTTNVLGVYEPTNFLAVYEPFVLIKSGEALLLWSTNGVMSCYNLKTASLENHVDYAPALGRNCGLNAIPHMNSFVSLKDLGENDVKVIGSDEGVIDQAPSGDLFHDYFRRADLDQDGLIRTVYEGIFFEGFDLPTQVLRQIFRAVNANQTIVLGEEEFYNALKLVSVVQSGKKLTPDIVNETLHGPDSANIPAPKIVNSDAAAAAAAAYKLLRVRCHKVRCDICRKSQSEKFNLLNFLVQSVFRTLSFFHSEVISYFFGL